MIFMKPPSAFITENQDLIIPTEWDELHHEIELGVVIDKKCKNISSEEGLSNVGGYVLALDMTARKIQDELKKQAHPWLLAKGFDCSCPIGEFIPKENLSKVDNINLWLKVNGQMKQNGNTKDMIFSVGNLISYISKYITLEYGDLILTGTPSGVGPVKRGDQIEAGLKSDGVDYTMKFNVKS
ncbi:unnamed protein product [Didymodactylos carnosus]|uniref:oxaloacetate tautomerase n=1 Tax=Didymodactylos carnosus TaxID=1234261 RepID=A0A814ESG5_9BILA|nr:unnamed protein product [Didymodactylos carnosus]CAF0970089.1 unnamed protein product [Didymodactylos carnosus]CAF3585231.1 unnamed protein product [Didymodactylos carnosus]CAF3743235.1 unnamed protein product [Didymodactylos carnosus]